jgi:hypothetical protein
MQGEADLIAELAVVVEDVSNGLLVEEVLVVDEDGAADAQFVNGPLLFAEDAVFRPKGRTVHDVEEHGKKKAGPIKAGQKR